MDKSRRQTLRNNIFTPGFVIFALIYIFIIALDWQKVVPLLSDTSMHWAPHVLTMWLRDDFYTSPGLSIVNQGNYPPFIQLFELLFSKAAGVYREGLLFAAIQLLAFSMIMPVFRKLTWQKKHNFKQWGVLLLSTGVVIAIPLMFFVSDFYSSLEVDAILGVIFAYCVFVAIQESKKFTLVGLLRLSLAVTFLCMSKQIAIVLAALVVLIYLGNLFIVQYKDYSVKKVITYIKRWKNNWKTLVAVILLILLPLVCLEIWSHQIAGYKQPDPSIAIFHINPSDILQTPSIFLGHSGSAAQQFFSHSFISHILFDPGGFLLNIFGAVSYMQLVLLFVGFIVLSLFLAKKKDDRKRIAIVGVLITAGWFLYCFVLYCTFLYGGMKDVEMMDIDTPNRYLRTYIFAMFILVVFYIVKRLLDNRGAFNKRLAIFVTITFMIVFGIFFNKDTLASFGVKSTAEHKAEFTSLNIYQTKDDLAKLSKISGGTFQKPAKILITAATDNERHYLQYNALPNRITLILFEKDTTRDSICGKLAVNDYLVISWNYPNESDWSTIRSCLTGNYDLFQGSIYKIIKNNNDISLQKV